MIIRQEQSNDYDTVYQVVKAAFAHSEHSDGNEQELVATLRHSKAFVPQLSLVAVCEKNIVGHILFTKVTIGRKTELALAPLSVLPTYQRQGIGQALMTEGHRIAKELGYDYSIVLGHPQYYPKAGYVPASLYGIRSPFEVPDDSFMAVKLNPTSELLNGVVEYDPAFGV
ncbi:N-acetyltransferase [Lachnospiraceae bacterium]|nr:N-acetyltransferase [Lachnospiraceae bacterium]